MYNPFSEPSETAIRNGRAALEAARRAGLPRCQALPGAEGGLLLIWLRADKYADVECYDDGDILLAIRNDDGTKIRGVTLATLDESLVMIRDFLGIEAPKEKRARLQRQADEIDELLKAWERGDDTEHPSSENAPNKRPNAPATI